jgi:hypothetical protein
MKSVKIDFVTDNQDAELISELETRISNSNMELKSMEIVKTDNMTNTENAEIVAEVRNLIVKINNLLSHRGEPECLVDLMGDELIARHGRERLEQVAGETLGTEDPALSKKFTELWYPLLDRFLDGYPPFSFKVEVRYDIDRHNFEERFDKKAIFAVAASAEPIIVDKMLWKMSQLGEGIRAANADIHAANELFFAGTPDLEPSMRHLSAEEYIAKAREPITEEEWRRRLCENHPAPPREVHA